MTLRIPAKVLLHVWSYDFYDMTLSTGKQRRHMINICTYVTYITNVTYNVLYVIYATLQNICNIACYKVNHMLHTVKVVT